MTRCWPPHHGRRRIAAGGLVHEARAEGPCCTPNGQGTMLQMAEKLLSGQAAQDERLGRLESRLGLLEGRLHRVEGG
jgi:hypothetical protein